MVGTLAGRAQDGPTGAVQGAPGALSVCTYGFNVPCRRFLVTANITLDRRLPVVDEFVLRVLRLCERLPARRLGAFFGLSANETETVVGDLVARGLVAVDDDAVVLHPSAAEHFRGAGEDGVPRLMQVETWFERIWFDLVSRNMMTPERARATRNLIEIKPDEGARELPTAFARRAFEENFAEYLRKVRRINNPDRFGLYSVSDVEAGRFGFVVIKGREDLVLDPQPRLEPNLLEVDVEGSTRYRGLITAMTDAYRRLGAAEPSATALTEYGRLTDDRTVQAAHHGGCFNLERWQADEDTRSSPERRPLLGASYLDRNVQVLVELLEKRALPAIKGEKLREVELVWLRPAGTAWGCSPDLQEALSGLRAVLRHGFSKDCALRTTLVVPQAARRDQPRRFDRVFDRGVFAPPGHLSPALEVILLRGLVAMTLVRVSLAHATEVPVGSVTSNRKAVERIEAYLQLRAVIRGEQLWARHNSSEDSQEATGAVP